MVTSFHKTFKGDVSVMARFRSLQVVSNHANGLLIYVLVFFSNKLSPYGSKDGQCKL